MREYESEDEAEKKSKMGKEWYDIGKLNALQRWAGQGKRLPLSISGRFPKNSSARTNPNLAKLARRAIIRHSSRDSDHKHKHFETTDKEYSIFGACECAKR